MGLIGHEIIQSRVWEDPNASAPPLLNYKLTYPITVFDAVREDMKNESSITLRDKLNQINSELENRQPIIPGKAANNLMTYGGIPGSVGSIEISNKIPHSADAQSDEKIPTEKAVGDLIRKFGLSDNSGNPGNNNDRVLWENIIGRPEVYNELGTNRDGYIHQEGLTGIINNLKREMTDKYNEIDSSDFGVTVTDHIRSQNNPHNVTARQIGAIDQVVFENHTSNQLNPHNVTAEQIGLGNVNNTSDVDKPISRATREELDRINAVIGGITGSYGTLKYPKDISYNQSLGKLIVTYNNGDIVNVPIITDGLVDEISFDRENKELVITELNGTSKRISIGDLIGLYYGSKGPHIQIIVDPDNTIKANVLPKSITSNEIRDNSIANISIADKTISGAKIRDLTITSNNLGLRSVTTDKIIDDAIKDSHVKKNALTGRALFTTDIPNSILAVKEADSNAIWTKITSDMIEEGGITSLNLAQASITDDKLSTDSVRARHIVNSSITGDKLVDNAVLKSPKIESSPSDDSNDNSIPDTRWVKHQIANTRIDSPSIADRSVKGNHLFSTNNKNRVLVVTESNGDPYWGRISLGMLADESVNTESIKRNAITEDKLNQYAVSEDKIKSDAVSTEKIKQGSVTGIKIFPSDTPERVLAVGPEGGHPVYTQITPGMIGDAAISGNSIVDRTITPDKMKLPIKADTVLAFDFTTKTADWIKVKTPMIDNYAVTGEKIMTSPVSNMVLSVSESNTPAKYSKVSKEMLDPILIEELVKEVTKKSGIVNKTITSYKNPTNGQHGDVWLKYS